MQPPLIFILEDDPPLLEVFEAFLTEEGYRVVSWSTAAGAYQQLRVHRPALSILDVRMERPEAGWELIQLVRCSADMQDLPIVVSTADVSFVHAHADALAELRCAVVVKPFALDTLLQVVERELLRGMRA